MNKLLLATWIAVALIAAASFADAAGFQADWETNGCPADCKYQPEYEVEASNQEFLVVYPAFGGVQRFFSQVFELPEKPTSSVTFRVRAISSVGLPSPWSNSITIEPEAWDPPPSTTTTTRVNPYVPTLHGIVPIP